MKTPKKLVWRKLNVKVPPSKVIIGGVDSIPVSEELSFDTGVLSVP